MASQFGRKVVAYKVNKSGGSVAAGDVVVPDTSNDNAFTTTTSVAVTTGAWVADEAIASNATGRVVISGHVTLINVSASVTRGHTGTTHSVAKQAVSTGSTARASGTFCKFTTGGTTPEADIWPVDLGAGSGVGTGNAGAVYAMGNGAGIWNAGTSFPGSKATNDRYWRTDLSMEFYWDGTRWLSTQLFTLEMRWIGTGASQAISSGVTAATNGIVPGLQGGSDIWIVGHHLRTFINAGTALDGSNKWVMTTNTLDVNDSATLIDTINLNSGASSIWRSSDVSIGALLNNGTVKYRFYTTYTKTGTPGNLNFLEQISYRIVAT